MRIGTTPPLTAAVSPQTIDRGQWRKAEALDAEALWTLYDRCGPVRYGLNFKASAASKITYYAALRPNLRDEPEPVDDGPANEAIEQLAGPSGDLPDLIGELCLQLDVVGEGYLVGNEEDGGRVDWDVWSSTEWNEQAAGYGVRRHPDAVTPLDDESFSLRIWRPHPRMRYMPDSPLRSVADEVEQYILIRDMVTSIAWSRLPAGLLAVPTEILPNRTAVGTDAHGQNPFLKSLEDALVASVTDTRSASRIAPITVTGPAQYLEQLRVIEMVRDLPSDALELWERVTRQIASGLDLPAEILLGLADVNHWGQWLIDDSARLNHVDPLVMLILDAITRGYLHPYLEEQGVANARDYILWRDYSDLTSRTLTVDEAAGLYDRGIISSDAMRRIADLSEEDAPEVAVEGTVTPMEGDRDLPDTERPGMGQVSSSDNLMDADAIAKRVNSAGILIRSGFLPQESLRAVGLPDIPHTGRPPVTIQREGEAITAALNGSSIALTDLNQIDRRAYDRIAEVAQAGMDRALEKAGAKIRSRVQGDREPNATLRAKIDGIPNGAVGETLGVTVKDVFQLSDDDLIPPDSFNAVGDRVSDILEGVWTQTVSKVPVDAPEPPERRSWISDAVAAFTAALAALAIRRFFGRVDEEPGEQADVNIPANLVWDTLTVAGGGLPQPEGVRGLASGQWTQDQLVANGYGLTGYIWTVGSPSEPFEPHQRLSGVNFQTVSDPVLRNPESWPPVPYLFPGDHRGCQCSRVLVVEPPMVNP